MFSASIFGVRAAMFFPGAPRFSRARAVLVPASIRMAQGVREDFDRE